MSWRARILSRRGAVTIGCAAYLAAAIVRAAASSPGGAGLLGFVCLVLTLALAIASLALVGTAPAEEGARRSDSALALLLAVGSLPVGEGSRAFGAIGGGLATVVALAGAARIRGPGGLGAGRPIDTAIARRVAVGAWALVGAAYVAHALGIARSADESWLGGGASAIATAAIVAYLLARATRGQLELGVPAQALAATIALLAGVLAGEAIAIVGQIPAGRGLLLGLALGAAAAAEIAAIADPARVIALARRLAVLVVIVTPLTAVAAGLVAEATRGAAPAAIAAAAVAVSLGMAARRLDGVFFEGQSRHARAAEHALASIRLHDPDELSRGVLAALKEPSGPSGPSPALYTHDPEPRLHRIDTGGYLEIKEARWPIELIEVARGEPYATVRVEVLRALDVRRPDLRVALRFMEEEEMEAATAIVREGEPVGLLTVPERGRRAPASLEEVVALKALCDHLAHVGAVEAKVARGLAREDALREEIEAEREKNERLRHDAELQASRSLAHATRLARPAAIGIYSAGSRLAYDALERRARAQAPTFVVARAGIDPVPTIARAHLAGPRARSPLVVVDGTSTREHDLERWSDPERSPIAIADGGVLLLVDAPCLPPDVQRLVARALAERRPPWERAAPIDVVVVATATRDPRLLRERGELDESLASRLGDALDDAIALPRLSERPEDLRAIVTDRLAREGLRRLGRPVGIDDGAFALLCEHPFPGEDAELALIVQTLVGRIEGDVVRAADVRALGLPAPESEDGEPSAGLKLVK